MGQPAVAELRNPLVALPLRHQRPAPADHALREAERKPLLGRERHHGFCPLLRGLPFPTELMDPPSPVQGDNQAVGVCQLLRGCHRLKAALQKQPTPGSYPP